MSVQFGSGGHGAHRSDAAASTVAAFRLDHRETNIREHRGGNDDVPSRHGIQDVTGPPRLSYWTPQVLRRLRRCHPPSLADGEQQPPYEAEVRKRKPFTTAVPEVPPAAASDVHHFPLHPSQGSPTGGAGPPGEEAIFQIRAWGGPDKPGSASLAFARGRHRRRCPRVDHTR